MDELPLGSVMECLMQLLAVIVINQLMRKRRCEILSIGSILNIYKGFKEFATEYNSL